jgi:hypothetical protein
MSTRQLSKVPSSTSTSTRGEGIGEHDSSCLPLRLPSSASPKPNRQQKKKQPPLATTRTKAADRAAPSPDLHRRSDPSPRSGQTAHLLVADGGNCCRGVTSGGARIQLHGLRPRRRLHGVGGAGRRPRPAEGRQLQLACGCGCGGVVCLGWGMGEEGGVEQQPNQQCF